MPTPLTKPARPAVARAVPAAAAALAALLLAAPLSAAHAVAIGGLFNTGVDAAGNALAGGATDPHYLLEGPGFASAPANVVATYPAWNIPFDATGARWIGATGLNDPGDPVGATPGNPAFDYTFSTSFDLTGLDPTTAQIDLTFASDNQSLFFINGVPQNATPLGAFSVAGGGLTTISLTSGFVGGTNTLSIRVDNGQSCSFSPCNPMGLLITDIAGSADLLVNVPLPATLPLLGGGLALLAAVGGCRRRPAARD